MGDSEGTGVPDAHPRYTAKLDNAEQQTRLLPATGSIEGDGATDVAFEDVDTAENPPRQRSRKKLWTALGVVVVLLAGAGVFVAVLAGGGGEANQQRAPVPVRTVAVERGDLSKTATLAGTLDYTAKRSVSGATNGIVTWLPEVGDTIGRGEQLYRVDGRRVSVFYGRTPLYRRLDTEGMVGRDVRVVADNLAALGYSIGPQPPVGTVLQRPETQQHNTEHGNSASEEVGSDAASRSDGNGSASATDGSDHSGTGSATVTVHEGEAVLTASLIDAIARWQHDMGMPATGALGPADVVVVPGKIRVSAVRADLGDHANDTLLTVSSLDKAVTVRAEVSELDAIAEGQQVTVTLPDGSTAHGRVTSIESMANSRPGGGLGPRPGESKRKVTITVREQDKLRDIKPGPVHVRFSTTTHENVLIVPIGALVALREGGYAVRIPDRGLVGVRLGLSVRGKIEISGKGIEEGTRVVTTS